MGNMVEFFRMFFSYVLVFVVYVAVAGVGIFCGLLWNKKKSAKSVAGSGEKPVSEQGE